MRTLHLVSIPQNSIQSLLGTPCVTIVMHRDPARLLCLAVQMCERADLYLAWVAFNTYKRSLHDLVVEMHQSTCPPNLIRLGALLTKSNIRRGELGLCTT